MHTLCTTDDLWCKIHILITGIKILSGTDVNVGLSIGVRILKMLAGLVSLCVGRPSLNSAPHMFTFAQGLLQQTQNISGNGVWPTDIYLCDPLENINKYNTMLHSFKAVLTFSSHKVLERGPKQHWSCSKNCHTDLRKNQLANSAY